MLVIHSPYTTPCLFKSTYVKIPHARLILFEPNGDDHGPLPIPPPTPPPSSSSSPSPPTIHHSPPPSPSTSYILLDHLRGLGNGSEFILFPQTLSYPLSLPRCLHPRIVSNKDLISKSLCSHPPPYIHHTPDCTPICNSSGKPPARLSHQCPPAHMQ